MDYLDEQEDVHKKSEDIKRLRQRKKDLIERLKNIGDQKFEIELPEEVFDNVDSDDVKNVLECKAILDMYRLHGVCIKSMGPDLVLRFDPLYRNQYPDTEHYSVELLRQGDNFKLGKHNLPPFIPAHQLFENSLENGIKDFVEDIRKLLYAYIQRREGLKQAKKTFEDNLGDKFEVDLSVSYVKFLLQTSENIPQMEVTLQYSLDRCLPDSVEVTPVEDEEMQRVSKKTLEQIVSKCRQNLLNKDIYTALTEVVSQTS